MPYAALAFVVSLLLSGTIRLIAGPGLGTLLGCLPIVIFPAAYAGLSRRPLLVYFAAVLPIGLILLSAGLNISEYLRALAVILPFAAVTTALSFALRSRPNLALSIAVVFPLAYLTWPLWLTPALVGRRQWLIDVLFSQLLITPHPLFALNSVGHRFGIWTEQSVAYRLTNLGQDLSYTLPDTIARCAMAHIVIAAVLIVLSRRFNRPARPAASSSAA